MIGPSGVARPDGSIRRGDGEQFSAKAKRARAACRLGCANAALCDGWIVFAEHKLEHILAEILVADCADIALSGFFSPPKRFGFFD